MKWISTSIKYKRVRVYKNSYWGKTENWGYELIEPLIFELQPKVWFYLPVGYVWNGPSFPSFLEWILGKRNTESLLAASAMHDIFHSIPVKYGDTMRNTTFNIKDGAKMYRKMIELWPNNTIKSFSRRAQYYAILYFQGILRFFSGVSNWKKIEE